MNKTLTLFVACAFTAFSLVTPASAMHGGCNGNITTIDAGVETIYIDDRAPSPNDPPLWGFFIEGEGTWIYVEANGEEGLQSGGQNPWANQQPLLVGYDECDHANSDQMIF